MDNFSLTFFILLLLLFLFSDQAFFDLLYNSKLGRFVIIVLLIAISIISIWLSFLFLLMIMYFSQLKNTTPESFDKMDRVNISEVLNNNFLYKNYKQDNVYKKSKKMGVNVVKASEQMRPKSSKNIQLTSYKPKNVLPYSKNSYSFI
jgi:hypothetical protein